MTTNGPIASRVKKQGRYFWLILINQPGFDQAMTRIRDSVANNENMSLHEIATKHFWTHLQLSIGSSNKIDIYSEWNDDRLGNLVNVWSDEDAVPTAEAAIVQPLLDEGGRFVRGGE